MSHRAKALLLAAAIASGCQALDSVTTRQPAIPDIPFAGDRPDAPPLEQRGNGTFLFASYDPSGKYLVTVPFMGPPAGLISWDATTGELLSHLLFQIPMYSKPIWMLDGTRSRGAIAIDSSISSPVRPWRSSLMIRPPIRSVRRLQWGSLATATKCCCSSPAGSKSGSSIR